jgi:CHASE3 domain sensor protein
VQLRPKLVASYLCATLVLSVGVVTVIQNREAQAAADRSNSLGAVLHQLLEVQLTLRRAEAGQRGYLLTGDPRHRALYAAAAPRMEERLTALAELVRDAPAQMHQVHRLRALARLKLAELAETIRVREAGGDALARMKSDAEQRLMERCERLAKTLAQDVRHARDAQARRAAALQKFALRFVGFGSAFAFALAVAITFWIGKAFRDSEMLPSRFEYHTEN